MKKKRIFIAAGLPEGAREDIAGAIKRWQWLPIRWIPSRNWHITVIPPFFASASELENILTLINGEANKFNPLERRRLCRQHSSEIADGSLMLSSAGREAPVLTGFTRFSLQLDSIILAPPERKARMIWFSGPPSTPLQELKSALGERIATGGILCDYKTKEARISPHITLARFEEGGLRQIEERTKILERLPIAFEVAWFDIMESRLKTNGAEYITVAKVSLAEGAADERT